MHVFETEQATSDLFCRFNLLKNAYQCILFCYISSILWETVLKVYGLRFRCGGITDINIIFMSLGGMVSFEEQTDTLHNKLNKYMKR